MGILLIAAAVTKLEPKQSSLGHDARLRVVGVPCTMKTSRTSCRRFLPMRGNDWCAILLAQLQSSYHGHAVRANDRVNPCDID